jgi:hypothetical protein
MIMAVRTGLGCALGVLALPVSLTPAHAQTASIESLQSELSEARAQIDAQRRTLEAQEARLRALEARFQVAAAQGSGSSPIASSGTAIASASLAPPRPGAAPSGVEQVGEGPAEIEMPQVAVLGDQGSIVTKAGQFTAEASVE